MIKVNSKIRDKSGTSPESEKGLIEAFMEVAICDYDELVQGEGAASDDIMKDATCDDMSIDGEMCGKIRSDVRNVVDPDKKSNQQNDVRNVVDPDVDLEQNALSERESFQGEHTDKGLQDANMVQGNNNDSDTTIIYEHKKEDTTLWNKCKRKKKIKKVMNVPVAVPSSCHGYKLKCPVCGKIEKLHTAANKHLEEAHHRHWFTCCTCKKKFTKNNPCINTKGEAT